MKIPDAVRSALLNVCMSASEWNAIRTAFDAIPEPEASTVISEESLEKLHYAAIAVNEYARIRAIETLPVEGEQTWDEMKDTLFRTLWTLWGGEGALAFAARFKIGKTTVFRKLRELGIPRPTAPAKRRQMTIPAIRAEIERIMAMLTELEKREGFPPTFPKPQERKIA